MHMTGGEIFTRAQEVTECFVSIGNDAAASQLATDRERWREIIKVTAAQIAPPD